MYSDIEQERFWSKVNKTPTCWLWTASTRGGYGQVSSRNKMMNSHRLAFQMTHNREIKPGFVIAHQPKVCHNVLCCNPAHLRETTQAENMRDKYEDGTMPMGKSHPVARRFTEDQIRAIRADTRLLREIAMEYGCDYRNVSHIKRRTKYAWVEDLPSQS